MGALASLIDEVELTIESRSDDRLARTLSRVTDLYLLQAGKLREEHVELFDAVIQRLARAIAAPPRAELAERLVSLKLGPKGVLRDLAYDREIVVARPVLAQAPLDDQDLLAIAAERSREHRLAICERLSIAEAVTDVLVVDPDATIRRAVASNEGARLSAVGTATLVDSSEGDEELQDALGKRTDLPATESRRLLDIALDTARRELATSLPANPTNLPPVRTALHRHREALSEETVRLIRQRRHFDPPNPNPPKAG